MPQTHLDCKGLACPGPVLECKRLVEARRPECVTVSVDNEAAKENVSRFLKNQGYEVVSDSDRSGAWNIVGTFSGSNASSDSLGPGGCSRCEVIPAEEIAQLSRRTVVFITADSIGHGDETLGGKLMKSFIATLPELGDELWRIILVNGGVKLSINGSPVLDELKRMADGGLSILVCGTCLDFFGLLDRKAVGETTNMLDVVTSLQLATKVIQI